MAKRAGRGYATRCSARSSRKSGGGLRCWVIDPIDATMNYVRGVPVWATLIGLMDGAEVVVGVVSAPALGRRWWAVRDGGAWTGRSLAKATRCRVSSVANLADASLSYSSLSDWAEHGRLAGFLDLSRSVWRTRAYGDFWSHVLVAEGAVDVSAEPEVSLWDLAALQVIVEEAGGTFSDLGGRPTPDGGSALVSNGLLHTEVLKLARPAGYVQSPGGRSLAAHWPAGPISSGLISAFGPGLALRSEGGSTDAGRAVSQRRNKHRRLGRPARVRGCAPAAAVTRPARE